MSLITVSPVSSSSKLRRGGPLSLRPSSCASTTSLAPSPCVFVRFSVRASPSYRDETCPPISEEDVPISWAAIPILDHLHLVPMWAHSVLCPFPFLEIEICASIPGAGLNPPLIFVPCPCLSHVPSLPSSLTSINPSP
ncbi:unnamed protein product, partial [Choristocarpus tenellus]